MVRIKLPTISRCVLTVLSSVLLVGSVTTAEAQKEGQKKKQTTKAPVYIGGDAGIPSRKLAVLDVSDERLMRIIWVEGVWDLPYDRITNLYVSLSRPSAMVELGGSVFTAPFMLGALKNRKLFLGVTYDGVNEVPAKCIFLVRQGYGEVVDLLAERSKRNVVFETYDARRRLNRPQ